MTSLINIAGKSHESSDDCWHTLSVAYSPFTFFGLVPDPAAAAVHPVRCHATHRRHPAHSWLFTGNELYIKCHEKNAFEIDSCFLSSRSACKASKFKTGINLESLSNRPMYSQRFFLAKDSLGRFFLRLSRANITNQCHQESSTVKIT